MEMKASLRKLNLLFRLTGLRPDMFYSISIEPEISLQGKFRPEIVLYLKDKGYHARFDTNGHAVFARGNIGIVLT